MATELPVHYADIERRVLGASTKGYHAHLLPFSPLYTIRPFLAVMEGTADDGLTEIIEGSSG